MTKVSHGCERTIPPLHPDRARQLDAADAHAAAELRRAADAMDAGDYLTARAIVSRVGSYIGVELATPHEWQWGLSG